MMKICIGAKSALREHLSSRANADFTLLGIPYPERGGLGQLCKTMEPAWEAYNPVHRPST